MCSAFVASGVRKLRLTGGEPLVRRGIMTLVAVARRAICDSGALDELTLTTNGSQLPKYAAELKGYGVERINVSLDTLDPDKFRAITRWGELDKVLAGIDAAQAAGLKVKINAVALQAASTRTSLPTSGRMGARPRHGSHHHRGDAARRHRRRPARPVSAAVDGARAARRALHARGDRLPHRRPGALRQRQGDRRAARLHHAADAQLLREPATACG